MREGQNPADLAPQLEGFLRHRVIVPVYIPHFEGYFRQALEVLSLCLESAYYTTRGRASITVISNGSHGDVVSKLQQYQQEGCIDQLLLNRTNRGKVDAVTAAARGCFEPLVTISDSDVLFQPGWLEAVEDIFMQFPQCGYASPVPDPALTWYFTSATVLGAVARRNMGFAKLVPDEDLDRFAKSIGNPSRFGPEHRASQMYVNQNGTRACVGCGHFVFTIRREVLAATPSAPSQKSYSDRSEELWLDRPNDEMGLWRLATIRALAYHMGNIPEPWMYDEFAKCREAHPALPDTPASLPAVARDMTGRLPWRLRTRLLTAYRRLSQNRKATNL